jgi:hypothetical protein
MPGLGSIYTSPRVCPSWPQIDSLTSSDVKGHWPDSSFEKALSTSVSIECWRLLLDLCPVSKFYSLPAVFCGKYLLSVNPVNRLQLVFGLTRLDEMQKS